MLARDFWREVRRRRNHFFLTGVAWLVAGFPLLGLWRLILPTDDLRVSGAAALFTWGAFWWWVKSRLTGLNCYSCGRQAFRHPFFFMRDAKCQCCGASFSADRS